jgi:hypothetical protein
MPWSYTVNAPAYPALRVQPQQLYLGALPPGSQEERELVIDTYAPAGSEPLEPRLIAVDNPQVTARLGDSRLDVLEDSVVHRATKLLVSVATPFEVDRHVAHLTVGGAGSTEALPKERRVTVSWMVASPLRLSPERIFLSNEAKGSSERVRRVVTIMRGDGAPFAITRILASDEAITAEYQVDGPRTWTVTITIDMSRVVSHLAEKVVLETDCRDAPSISIPVAVIMLTHS